MIPVLSEREKAEKARQARLLRFDTQAPAVPSTTIPSTTKVRELATLHNLKSQCGARKDTGDIFDPDNRGFMAENGSSVVDASSTAIVEVTSSTSDLGSSVVDAGALNQTAFVEQSEIQKSNLPQKKALYEFEKFNIQEKMINFALSDSNLISFESNDPFVDIIKCIKGNYESTENFIGLVKENKHIVTDPDEIEWAKTQVESSILGKHTREDDYNVADYDEEFMEELEEAIKNERVSGGESKIQNKTSKERKLE